MKANELRIGNWVRFKDYLIEEQQVTEIKSIGDNSHIEPIVLTEERLLGFGFEKNGNRFSLGDFEIEKQGLNFAYAIWDESAPHLTIFIGHHQYVHQLQNLYFALKNEELIFKQNN